MKRTFLRTLLCLLPLLPSAARADEGDIIDIVFSGNQATVDIPATAAVSATVNGAYVNIISSATAEEYVYRLTGSTSSGGLILNGNYKLTLQLAGVSIASQQGAAIDIECGKRIAVQLVDGTVNTLSDAPGGAQKAALYFTGHPEFEGGGVLNVTGNSKHAISAKEYLQMKKTTGTINILSSASDGVHCGKGKVNNDNCFFQISGGVLNITNVKGDCIDSDDYGIMLIKGGIINANVTEDDAVGLKCDSIIYMTGGEVNVNVSGQDSEGIRACYDALFTGGTVNINVSGRGSKGIKGKNKTNGLVLGGGRLHFDGTDLSIYVHGGDLKADDGTVATKTRAISADDIITRTAGLIDIYAYGDISNPYHSDTGEQTEGGTLAIHRAPWPFYFADFQHEMSAFVALQVNGLQAAAEDYAIGAFIGNRCVGVAIDGYLRIYADAADAGTVTFRAYGLTDGQTYIATPAQDVTFAAGSVRGSAEVPLLLTASPLLPGDVNADKSINVADVTALVNIILGKATDNWGTADVNADGHVNVSDVTRLVNIILGR